MTLQQYQVFIVCFTVSNERHLHHKGFDGVYEGVVKLKMFMRTRFYLNFWKNVSTLFLFPKVAMRIQIKLTKCEEIGIFCRNIAEKFIFKFAKLFYIKKHEDLCHFPAQFVISITKKNKILNQLVGGCVTRDATRPPASSETDLIRKLMFFISLLNDITAEKRSAFSSLQKYFVEPLHACSKQNVCFSEDSVVDLATCRC